MVTKIPPPQPLPQPIATEASISPIAKPMQIRVPSFKGILLALLGAGIIAALLYLLSIYYLQSPMIGQLVIVGIPSLFLIS